VALLLTAACYNERVGLDFEGTTDATIGVPFRLTIVTNGELAPSFVDAVYRCQGNVLVPLPGERQAGLLWERSSAAYNTSVIAGTPTDVGRHCFRLVVDRTNEPDKSFDVTITVHPKLIALSPGSLQSGAGNFTLQVAGQGFGTVGGESSRALWNGAARPTRILSATQLEADIPATDLGQAGTVQVTVDNGFEGGGLSNALAFEVSASPVPSITTATLPTGAVGQPYSATLQAAGGTGALAWSLTPTSETLPPGLNLSAGGVISGTPTSAGTRTLTVQVQDSASPPHVATRVLVLDVLGTLQLAGAALPNGTVGPLYRTTLQVTGGLAPLGFSVVGGTLPPGLGLDAATGVLEGNATTGGRYDFSLQVQDASVPPAVATRAYTVLILEITTTALPDAAVGQPYSLTLAVIGQVPPSTWAAAPGTTLPPGIGVTSAGTLTGTPTTTGVFLFSVEVTDSDTPPRRTTKGFSLTVENPRPVVTALVPSSMPPASPAFTLTVDGQGFLPASEVRWNGVARATSFVNATRLTASIAAADVASAGTASVTVSNPSPGGGPSNALTFTIGGGPGPGSGPGVTDLVSQSSTGVAANAPSAITGLAERLIAISANGNRVAFSSEATNLDSPHPGVFVRDIALGATRRVSSTLLDATPNSIVGESLAISADGLWVAFESRASNHVNGDTGQDGDIFVVQSCLPHVPAICPAPDWVSVMPDGTEPLSGASSTPSLSATGRFVAFSSNSPLIGLGLCM
jgi:hypothetical protein